MIPFPGESAALDWANVTAGAPFADGGDAIRYRAGSSTLTAGDVFVAGFYDSRYVEPGVDAVFSVAVETLAGSSGTLRLSGGPDATFSLGDAEASAHPLGDHVVTGATTLVVALPWVTVADYLTEAVETAVRVECLSGTVDVQQVKLRIWPPTGALGAWSAAPFVQDPVDANPAVIAEAGGLPPGVNYPSQGAFRTALAAVVTTFTGPTGTSEVTFGFMSAYDDVGSDLRVNGGIGITYLGRPGDTLNGPGLEEDAWIVPPNEVRGDDDRVIFDPTGPDSTTWLQPVATVARNSLGLPPVTGNFHLDAVAVADTLPVGTAFVDAAQTVTLASLAPDEDYQDVTLPEFDDVFLQVSMWHPGHYADTPETGGTDLRLQYGQTIDGSTYDRLLYRWQPAPYRYWDPVAVARSVVRQWNQRFDELGQQGAAVWRTDPATNQWRPNL